MNNQHLQSAALYRIGAISKLSGIPVPTLRVWQTRYSAFSPATSQGQHRLYNDDDLRKATLLKTLTRQGHAISLIAGLTNEQLTKLPQTSADMAQAPLQGLEATTPNQGAWGVVGKSLAERLQSTGLQASRQGHGLQVTQVWADLNDALSGQPDSPTDERLDVLLVSVNSLNSQTAQQILTLQQRHNARLTVVLYGYGQSQALTQLSRAACQLHRNSLDDAALADIVQSARPAWVTPPRSWRTTGQAIPARQFSDAVLQRVANIPSQVLCECPKHVAELIGQLGRFEDYSRDCLNQSPKDTELHTYLNDMAASARALFEEALQTVASYEGISLQEQA